MTKLDERQTQVSRRFTPGWVALLFIAAAAGTVPWIAYLAISLPHTEEIHDRLAWVGFDIGLVIMLGFTGYLAWRRHPRLALAAIATATMLVVDAWFDVLTSERGSDQYTAIGLAVVELSMAAFCVWTAIRARS